MSATQPVPAGERGCSPSAGARRRRRSATRASIGRPAAVPPARRRGSRGARAARRRPRVSSTASARVDAPRASRAAPRSAMRERRAPAGRSASAQRGRAKRDARVHHQPASRSTGDQLRHSGRRESPPARRGVPRSTTRPALEHHDLVGVAHGGEAVRDHQAGDAARAQVRLDPRFATRDRARSSPRRGSGCAGERASARAISRRWRCPPLRLRAPSCSGASSAALARQDLVLDRRVAQRRADAPRRRSPAPRA